MYNKAFRRLLRGAVKAFIFSYLYSFLIISILMMPDL